MLHKYRQTYINKRIVDTVEKIEDAKSMDNLNYHHLHHRDNIPHYRYVSHSFSKSTYKWIWLIPDDCMDRRGRSDHCTKTNTYLFANAIHIDNSLFVSEIDPNNPRKFKMKKIDVNNIDFILNSEQ